MGIRERKTFKHEYGNRSTCGKCISRTFEKVKVDYGYGGEFGIVSTVT